MIELQVNDMSCGHCVQSITKAIQALDATAIVSADLETKRVRIETSALKASQIVAALANAGYEARSPA